MTARWQNRKRGFGVIDQASRSTRTEYKWITQFVCGVHVIYCLYWKHDSCSCFMAQGVRITPIRRVTLYTLLPRDGKRLIELAASIVFPGLNAPPVPALCFCLCLPNVITFLTVLCRASNHIIDSYCHLHHYVVFKPHPGTVSARISLSCLLCCVACVYTYIYARSLVQVCLLLFCAKHRDILCLCCVYFLTSGGSRKKYLGGLAPHHLGGNHG